MSDRVWDQFLTPQDRAHLKLVTRSDEVSYGNRPALLLIDLYRYLFGDEPEPLLEATQAWPGSCGLAAWEALPRIEALLRAARKAAIPVIHVTAEGWMPSWQEVRSVDGRSRDENEARKYEMLPQLAPLESEPILRKASPSAFWGTSLAGRLNRLRVDTLIVSGAATSGCVRATAVDARAHQYKAIVVEECVFDRYEVSHAISLFDIARKYADVLPLDEVKKLLATRWSRA